MRDASPTPGTGLDIVYYVVHTPRMALGFGDYVRKRREALRERDGSYSVRQVAQRIGVEPSFLSKVERGEAPPPSEAKIQALARELGEDPDVLLALAGKVSSDLQAAIRKRPELFATLIRELKDMPDHAVLSLVREVRDGKW
jgi:transcriptional regulator with XRE-family HTH domain